MKVFVTGGSGFVGGYLIPFLIERGHTVVALARSPETLDKVHTLGATAVRGDLDTIETLQSALAGCDAIVHLAAAFQMWGDEAWFYRVNVQGTDNLLEAAHRAGIRRFVYISAASVIAGGTPAHNVDESYRPLHTPDDLYSKTKLLAEQHVMAENSAELQTMALRPPLIWARGHSMIETIRDAVDHNRWVWIGGGRHGLSTVHVLNLCAATLAALERGRGGEVYFITDGAAQSVKTFLTDWLRTEGIQPSERSIVRPVVLLLARMLARLWRVFRLGGEPPLTPGMVYMLGTELTVSDRKAREQLGYRNTLDVADGLRSHTE